jgi:CheY-like chemotaxis protein/HPt (histidine-containing phosphotransfer) domain-containing protein
MGLGLTLSRRLVDLMGGQIRFEPAADGGSVFCVDLALPAADAPPRDLQWLNGKRVLLAEDNPVNQEVAQSLLEELGCTVVLAADGAEAVRRQREQRLDLILMDCHMPGLDGFEATRRIRAGEAGSGRLPIVALTADVQQATRGRCLAAGMDDYLAKPATRAQLRALLSKWLPAADTQSPAARIQADSASGEPADHAADDAEPVIDAAALGHIAALQRPGRDSVLGRVIGIYFESSGSLLAAMADAVKRGDAEALRNAAHSLKSSSANVGARPLADLCRQLEAVGREKRVQEAPALLARLDPVYTKTLAALKTYLPGDAEP